jgi:exopolysaccharide biosynthesis polyprenyl glycosylphosphotransferase
LVAAEHHSGEPADLWQDRTTAQGERIFAACAVLADLAAVAAGFALWHALTSGAFVAAGSSPASHPAGAWRSSAPALGTAFALLLGTVFWRRGLYAARAGVLSVSELEAVLRATAWASAVFAALLFCLRSPVDPARLGQALASVGALVLLERRAMCGIAMHLRASGALGRRIAVYGSAPGATALLVKTIEQSPHLHASVVASLDDSAEPDPSRRPSGHRDGRGWPQRLKSLHDLRALASERKLDEVIAVGLAPGSRALSRLLKLSQQCGLRVALAPGLAGLRADELEPAQLGVVPLLRVGPPRARPLYERAKRVADLALALALLALSAPLWPIVAALIRLDGPGPIFFGQQRVGRGGRLFRMWKFRTLQADADPYALSPRASGDPRVTRFGRLLRLTGIDELPQLLNVLRGEMSLVGPRPEMPFIVSEYSAAERSRLAVTPGITGLWQISADRSAPIHRNLQHDCYYARHRSLLLDAVILLETVFATLRVTGGALWRPRADRSGAPAARRRRAVRVIPLGRDTAERVRPEPIPLDALPWGATAGQPPKYPLFGIGVSATTYEEAVELVTAAARRRDPLLVAHLSVHGLVHFSRSPELRQVLSGFDIVAPDGQPVRWALERRWDLRLPDRVYGPELMDRLCARAARERLGIYLYGSTPPVLEALADRLAQRHRGLVISGCEAPPFRPLTPEEDQAVTGRIRESGARLLFVGLGCPRQESFAYEHRESLPAVQLCVGAAFDFLAGVKPMAPPWMQQRGLEWLFRLGSEPRRLWRRYLFYNTAFLVALGRESASRWWRERILSAHHGDVAPWPVDEREGR